MSRRKNKTDYKNKRLDLFLQELEIEHDKREKIISHVEELTFDTISKKTKPSLRLNKD